MTPLEIQFELKKLGITQASIARDAGVSEMMVSAVIRKKSISDRIMKLVAKKIKRDPRAVFFEHYFKLADPTENLRKV